MGTPVDYSGIRTSLRTLLTASASLANVRIYIEQEPEIGLPDAGLALAIFGLSRNAIASQPAAFGKQTIYNLRTAIWTFSFNMESYEAACTSRDGLLGVLELVLMENRTISNKVASSWLEGGEIFSARHPDTGIFVAAAETVLVSEVRAINT